MCKSSLVQWYDSPSDPLVVRVKSFFHTICVRRSHSSFLPYWCLTSLQVLQGTRLHSALLVYSLLAVYPCSDCSYISLLTLFWRFSYSITPFLLRCWVHWTSDLNTIEVWSKLNGILFRTSVLKSAGAPTLAVLYIVKRFRKVCYFHFGAAFQFSSADFVLPMLPCVERILEFSLPLFLSVPYLSTLSYMFLRHDRTPIDWLPGCSLHLC